MQRANSLALAPGRCRIDRGFLGEAGWENRGERAVLNLVHDHRLIDVEPARIEFQDSIERRHVLRHPQVRRSRHQRVQADGRQPDPERPIDDGLAARRPKRQADVSDARLEQTLTP